MSKQTPPLHAAYQKVLPLCVRTALGKARNRLQSLVWKTRNAVSPEKNLAKLQRKVSSQGAHRARLARQRALLRKKAAINVVFEVTGIPKWKADSLLRLMIQHPRFTPIVWHVPYNDPPDPERDKMEMQQCRDYFLPLGVKLVDYATLGDFPTPERPDVIFPNEPYNYLIHRRYHDGLMRHLICFAPYGFASIDSKEIRNQIIPNGALHYFVENETSRIQTGQLMDNRGVNIVASGHPMADSFLYPAGARPTVWKGCGPGMKKVIWAPHWTVAPDSCTFLFYGTFLRTGEVMLEMAEKYRDKIQFAFKPHPNLYYTLCKHPQWGKERTDAFYAKWREMPNTQFEDGAYVDLFMQSDAMIHDCGSFIQEYLFADKPCMYLKYRDNEFTYSAMAEDCLNAYQLGVTREEIEEFLQMVLRGEDPKAEVRRQLREKYLIPPNGQSAAQNIIDSLLMQGHHG